MLPRRWCCSPQSWTLMSSTTSYSSTWQSAKWTRRQVCVAVIRSSPCTHVVGQWVLWTVKDNSHVPHDQCCVHTPLSCSTYVDSYSYQYDHLYQQDCTVSGHRGEQVNYHGTSCNMITYISLSMQTQQRVLASAFLRSLRDPFPPSRTAGLNGLAVTSSYYTPQDVANKILPALSPILVDPDKTVRDKVCWHAFLT